MPLYAAIGPDGKLLTVAHSKQDAINIAGRSASRVYDESGSDPSALDGFAEFGRLPAQKMPGIAMQNAGIPVIDIDKVMKLSIEEAHARIFPFFPTTKTRKSGQVVPMKQYEKPMDMVDALLGQNEKTAKENARKDGARAPVDIQGLSLLPYSQGKEFSTRRLPQRGLGFCVGSSPACREACLVNTGHNVIDVYNQIIKISRTEALSLEPLAFGRILVEALKRHFHPRGGHGGYEPMVRLNVFSDLPWELLFPGIFEMFSGSQFYDYTKVPGREPPDNYDLTFSWSGRNEEWVEYEVARGNRIAVVFMWDDIKEYNLWRKTKDKESVEMMGLPKTFLGLDVVDGDVTDARPYDAAPCVVGLRWKPHGLGKEHNINLEENTAFIVPVQKVDGQLVAPEASRMSLKFDPDEREAA